MLIASIGSPVSSAVARSVVLSIVYCCSVSCLAICICYCCSVGRSVIPSTFRVPLSKLPDLEIPVRPVCLKTTGHRRTHHRTLEDTTGHTTGHRSEWNKTLLQNRGFWGLWTPKCDCSSSRLQKAHHCVNLRRIVCASKSEAEVTNNKKNCAWGIVASVSTHSYGIWWWLDRTQHELCCTHIRIDVDGKWIFMYCIICAYIIL